MAPPSAGSQRGYAFADLLERLREQHELELRETAQELREENQRLAHELRELQALLQVPGTVPLAVGTAGVAKEPIGSAHPRAPSSRAASADKDLHNVVPVATIPDPVLEPTPTARWLQPTGPINKVDRRHADLGEVGLKQKEKLQRRLCRRLGLGADIHPDNMDMHYVTVDDLFVCLQRRDAKMNYQDVASVLQELNRVDPSLPEASAAWASPPKIKLSSFADLVMAPGLQSIVKTDIGRHVQAMKKILLSKDVDEVIQKVTYVDFEPTHADMGISALFVDEEVILQKKLVVLNAVVTVALIISLLSLGLSLDYKPDAIFWLIIESVVCFIFLLEVVIKVSLVGVQAYVCGPARYWNWLDAFISTVAVWNLVADIYERITDEDLETGATRFALLLRVGRLSRVVRMIKLMRSKWLQDLAGMLVGFFIGAPWLFWVMVLLGAIDYLLAVGMRATVGPRHDAEDLIKYCGGNGDENPRPEDHECQVHKLYGYEYFTTVSVSMFTVFRCMIGDCTTRGGQSLAVHLGKGYGFTWYILYASGMVIAIFGIFNVITAVFVEATMTGLKNLDVQKKYARQYEAHYVHEKLWELVRRIRLLNGGEEVCMSAEDFVRTMTDPEVTKILDDLDVDQFGRAHLFDIFDSDADGRVALTELVETVVKMRGEPQKSDTVATWIAMRSLQERFEEFEHTILASQRRFLQSQGNTT